MRLRPRAPRADVAATVVAVAAVLLVCAGGAVALTPGSATGSSVRGAGAPGGEAGRDGDGDDARRDGGDGGGRDGAAVVTPGPWDELLAWSTPSAAGSWSDLPTQRSTPVATATTGAGRKPSTADAARDRRVTAADAAVSGRDRPRGGKKKAASRDRARSGAGGTVYLTFDDGPSPQYTERVLELLADHDAKATFFFLGSAVAAHPHLARRVAEAGHGLGNHSWSHRDLRRLKKRALKRELRRTQRAVRHATGTAPSCVRPPYGSTDRRVREHTRELGLSTQLWDVDPRDWDRRGVKAITRGVVREVRDGSVVLLHDGGGDRRRTLQALPTILERLSARGFRFAALCD